MGGSIVGRATSNPVPPVQELQADWLIYVVDSGQGLHFQLVFDGRGRRGGSVQRRLRVPSARTARVEHVGFGVVQVRSMAGECWVTESLAQAMSHLQGEDGRNSRRALARLSVLWMYLRRPGTRPAQSSSSAVPLERLP